MPNARIRPAFKEYVKNSSRPQLKRDLATLFNTFGEVREYYQTLLLSNGEQISLAHAKQIISDEFCPIHGFGKARASIARKAITSFSRLSPSREGQVDLLLHHVEVGVEFTKLYGDIDEPFYLSLERSFGRALALLTTAELRERFQDRCKGIVSSSDGTGWGFHDTLAGLYYQLYDEDE